MSNVLCCTSCVRYPHQQKDGPEYILFNSTIFILSYNYRKNTVEYCDIVLRLYGLLYYKLTLLKIHPWAKHHLLPTKLLNCQMYSKNIFPANGNFCATKHLIKYLTSPINKTAMHNLIFLKNTQQLQR